MSWHNLELNIATLEAETVNAVYDNVAFLKNALEQAGYTVDAIANPNASYDTEIRSVRKALQDVENDVYKVASVMESVYYDDLTTFTVWFRLPDYQRWVLTLNDIYDIVINGKGQWGGMTLTEETGNPDAQDKFGNDIYIRGDAIE